VLNTVIVALVTMKHLGAVVVLIFVSSEVIVFFIWNLGIEALQTAVTGFFFWRNLKISSYKAGFKVTQIKRIWRFATGMSLIGATNVALSQADKLFVSKVFSLETFGYYSAVWTLAGALFFLSYPIVTALFPRYAQLFGKGATKELSQLYRQSNRILAAIMLPFGISFLIFAEQILSIWLPMAGDPKLIAGVFRILVFAVMLNSFFNLPVNLQLSSGWTGMMITTNVVWLFIFPLSIYVLVSVMGLLGAPMSWLLYNLFCFIIVAQLAHRKLFGDKMRFHYYFQDIGVPFLSAFLIIGICSMVLPTPTSVGGKCIILGIVIILGETVTMLMIEDVRSKLLQSLRYGVKNAN
jgi:O-antigen/teichoic acid export membrane protein